MGITMNAAHLRRLTIFRAAATTLLEIKKVLRVIDALSGKSYWQDQISAELRRLLTEPAQYILFVLQMAGYCAADETVLKPCWSARRFRKQQSAHLFLYRHSWRILYSSKFRWRAEVFHFSRLGNNLTWREASKLGETETYVPFLSSGGWRNVHASVAIARKDETEFISPSFCSWKYIFSTLDAMIACCAIAERWNWVYAAMSSVQYSEWCSVRE